MDKYNAIHAPLWIHVIHTHTCIIIHICKHTYTHTHAHNIYKQTFTRTFKRVLIVKIWTYLSEPWCHVTRSREVEGTVLEGGAEDFLDLILDGDVLIPVTEGCFERERKSNGDISWNEHWKDTPANRRHSNIHGSHRRTCPCIVQLIVHVNNCQL